MFNQHIRITQNNGGIGAGVVLLTGGLVVAVIVGQALAAIMAALITALVITGCVCAGLATLTGLTLLALRYRRSLTTRAVPTAAPMQVSGATSLVEFAGYHPTTGQPLYLLHQTPDQIPGPVPVADVIPNVLTALRTAPTVRPVRHTGGAR